MSDHSTPDHAPRPLPVLPHSGKVDQLRAEAQSFPPAGPPGGELTSHVNRVEHEDREPSGLERQVIAVLRSIYDPEIPVNLYDLGLIYDIEIAPDNAVKVRMTLTAPGCPVAGSLPPEVEARLEDINEVKSATVELVWDPTWSREMMSEVARLELGM